MLPRPFHLFLSGYLRWILAILRRIVSEQFKAPCVANIFRTVTMQMCTQHIQHTHTHRTGKQCRKIVCFHETCGGRVYGERHRLISSIFPNVFAVCAFAQKVTAF